MNVCVYVVCLCNNISSYNLSLFSVVVLLYSCSDVHDMYMYSTLLFLLLLRVASLSIFFFSTLTFYFLTLHSLARPFLTIKTFIVVSTAPHTVPHPPFAPDQETHHAHQPTRGGGRLLYLQ